MNRSPIVRIGVLTLTLNSTLNQCERELFYFVRESCYQLRERVFQKNQISPTLARDDISALRAMYELGKVLNSYVDACERFVENYRWVAILGAFGRLLECVRKNEKLKNILCFSYTQNLLRLLYHSRGPYAIITIHEYRNEDGNFLMDPEYVIKFITHCYEHVRLELASAGIRNEYVSLEDKISEDEKDAFWFFAVLNMGSKESVDFRVRQSEIQSLAIDRLASNEAQFLETLESLRYLHVLLANLSTDEDCFITKVIIIGSYIGTSLAWLSCDLSSVIYNKAFAVNYGSRKARISNRRKTELKRKYSKYLDDGKWYRHEMLSIIDLVNKYVDFLDDLLYCI